ncbi:roundabout homolog 1-like [Melanotaenia boesemani]|uniref:roundabout homolog 1-like n=1 Tax=Melanotaenia boesemani TaxID=1250792 RepID=UPI001C03F0B6|nr:roundabout homolog 1-like [Melanotaenia boesemani]
MAASFVSAFLGLVVLLLWDQAAAAVYLNVSPNRQQFFKGESIQLSCGVEGGQSAAGLTLKRTLTDKTETCGADKAFRKCSGSTYTVSSLSSEDRGIYWCEDLSGEKSINVTITVSDQPFIIEIPALPVMVGSKVVLRCRIRNGSTTSVHLFKFGKHNKPLTAAPVGELTIINIQESDEGFYWCSDHGKKSPSSHLTVTVFPIFSPPPITSASSLLQLMRHLVVVGPFCISTALMISLFCCKKTEKTLVATVEMEEGAERDEGATYDYIDSAAVTTEHFF